MGLLLLFLFIGMPIAEIAVFIQAGGYFGLWPTVGAIIATAVIGTTVLRWQGLAVLRRAQSSLNQGEMPLVEVFDGLCLAIAGVLLLTPGFITDAIGFALLVPPVRFALRLWVAARLAGHIHRHGHPQQRSDTTIIEGEFSEAPANDDEPTPPTLDHKP